MDTETLRGIFIPVPAISSALARYSVTDMSSYPIELVMYATYRIAGNFGGKIIWRIALNNAFGGFYFGGWVSLIP